MFDVSKNKSVLCYLNFFYSRADKLLIFYRIMDVALDKAIKEIIAPVIQRSVAIASRTTKELILKVAFLACIR